MADGVVYILEYFCHFLAVIVEEPTCFTVGKTDDKYAEITTEQQNST